MQHGGFEPGTTRLQAHALTTQSQSPFIKSLLFSSLSPSFSSLSRKPTEQALEQAKKNVMENYLVVGVTEQLEDFLFVLEKLLPEFFTGVLDTYKTPG